jgi:uncharacterized protein
MSEDKKTDPLLTRYREASAQEQAEPSARVREAVLARAAALAKAGAQVKAPAKNAAANDSVWGWKVAASIAVIGFTGMVARHYIEAPPEERADTRAAASAPVIPTDAQKYKADNTLEEIAAAPPPIKPLVEPFRPAPSSAQPAARKKAADAVVAQRSEPKQTTERVKKPQPVAAEPPLTTLENKIAIVSDQELSAESGRRRQPEMSIGDLPLTAPIASAPAAAPSPASPAPIAAAPMAKIAAAAPAPAAGASGAPPVAAAPSPRAESAAVAAPARIASGAAARASSAPARAPISLAAPTELPLFAAIGSGDGESVRAQLAAGANADALARDGTSALMLAAQRGRSEVVAVLLRAGANVNARDAQGRTALSAALAQGHTEIAAMLRAAGAVE